MSSIKIYSAVVAVAFIALEPSPRIANEVQFSANQFWTSFSSLMGNATPTITGITPAITNTQTTPR